MKFAWISGVDKAFADFPITVSFGKGEQSASSGTGLDHKMDHGARGDTWIILMPFNYQKSALWYTVPHRGISTDGNPCRSAISVISVAYHIIKNPIVYNPCNDKREDVIECDSSTVINSLIVLLFSFYDISEKRR